MTSSMVAGERRWVSSRRVGMTVLGKVPKPLNLPSQRLENLGLDPNVEIVPKGTLSWGSRSSASASNAWGSSTLSPNADGSAGSPSHLSGRPSSGGSGTRPSTAGSDRTLEPTINAWGPNSRPSSASGALTSSQSSLTSSRPRSAETRPGSSHLSRFAGPPSDNSVAWGPSGIAEKLGVASSKNDGFSLSSGDFPTLGSERDNSGRNTGSQDHGSYGRPGSSSGKVAPAKDRSLTPPVGDVSANANIKSGTANTWKRDGSQHVEDGLRPSVEKWHGDPQPYLNTNVPPQHFDAWHGPPINAPGGVWYRGPPGGPPYAAPVAPGGFPIEPFPYYHPQIPATALANSQPVPPPGAGPRGPHPKNGDLYRPHVPGAYIGPGMPIRPGFYPGPVAYEGYYGPPMGYCNSNERDIPFMGMAAGPPVYNRYLGQNAPDPSNNHGRVGGHGSTGKTMVSEQVESGHPDDARGPYKVLLKQHNEWDGNEEERKWGQTVPANAPYLEKGDQPRVSSWKNEWGADHKKDEEMYSRRTTLSEDAPSQTSDNRGVSDSVKLKLPGSMGNAKAVDDSSVRDWASGGRHDGSISSREEQKNMFEVNSKANHSANAVGTGAFGIERIHSGGDLIPASHEVDVSTGDKTIQPAAASATAISRRPNYGVQGRLDHHGKRVNTKDADGLRKKPLAVESKTAVATANLEPTFNVQDRHTSAEAAEKVGINLLGKEEGESFTPMFDPSDCQAQRAKLREIAKQRAEQLQKEEEERTREQKAKALAKLEELNRRIQEAEGSTQKLEKAPPSGAIQPEREEYQTPAEPVMISSKYETPSSALVSDVAAQMSENDISGVGESAVLSRNSLLESPYNAQQESVVPHDQSLPLHQDAHNACIADFKAAPNVHDSSVSRHKRMGYKQKKNIPLEKNLTEKSIPSTTEVPTNQTDVIFNDTKSAEVAGEVGPICESSSPNNPNIMAEFSLQQRKKNNRSSKNKHKLEEAPSIAVLPSPAPKETNPAKAFIESGNPKASKFELDPSSVQSMADAKHSIQPSEQRFPLPGEESHGRVNNQWKSQHTRGMSRNPQTNRSAEKFHSSDAVPAKAFIESGNPKASKFELDPSSVQSLADAKHSIQPSEQRFPLPGEESHGRVNNQWKSQHTRRMPRNPQTNRSAEKFHSSDAVVWAPVRPLNKSEVMDEASHKTVTDTVTPTAKRDNLVQNSLKSKRAEMERYVPKPVAKELAQQGSIQQPVSSLVNQTKSDEIVGRAEPGVKSTEDSQPASSATGNAWRQRGSTESPCVQGLQDGSSLTSNPGKNVQKSIDQHQSLMPDVNSVKGQPKSSDEWNTSDSCNAPDNSDTNAPVTSFVKDQGVTGRGKRHPFKGHRSTGNNYDLDHRNINCGDTDKSYSHSAALEMSQADRTVASRENRGVGERTSSHWQPKSQAYSAHNQRGSRSSGGQNVAAEVGRANKKDSPPQGMVHIPPQHDKESGEIMAHPHLDQSLSEHKNVTDTPNVVQQEAKRERKVASFKVRPNSPNQGPVNTVEPAPPASMDTRNEQRFSSGFRKNGNQNNRSGRVHESRGDWSSAGQDNKQNNISANREQRHNLHYEYQAIGQHSNSKYNNFEGQMDGSLNSGSRNRERGQGHSKRGGGNLYGRQGGTVRVDAGYD